MGVRPSVHRFEDLIDCIAIFQIFDSISPGIVEWRKVSTKFTNRDRTMKMISNCNYAIDLGKELKFSLVGIQGKDLFDGNRTLTLALIWQLLRRYTLTVLARCTQSNGLATESDICDWSNRMLRNANKYSTFQNFRDPRFSSSRAIIDLVDAIRPDVINYGLIRIGESEETKMVNAAYALSVARKIGANIHATPRDIVEVNSQMILIIFASLMIAASQV